MSMTRAGTVLVTGGSGYIARYCIAQLLATGWKVRASLRDLDKAPEVRPVLAPFAADGASLEFAAADLSADDGWNEAA
jgi:dihydroflavonol-4-reductase